MDPSHQLPGQQSQPPSGNGEIVKRIRKGTKSCVECRHRKIRCQWTSPSDTICVSCRARGKQCVPQLYRRATAVPKLSSRDRINRLEAQIASLTASVTDNGDHHRRQSSVTQHEDYSSDIEASGEEPEARFPSEGPAASPPHHLSFLFDSARMNPIERDDEAGIYLSNAKVSKRYLDQARSRLQRLMPSRDWVLAVASYATPWLSLYSSIFPNSTSIANKEELIAQWDELQSPSCHPISMSMFLLTFAITALQVPERREQLPPTDWKDARTYAQEIAHTFESTIVSHTGLAITVEGIEAAVMFHRLQLGLGAIRSLWLSLRRTIALGELIGMPRAWHARKTETPSSGYTPRSSISTTRDRNTQKIAIWEAICATDRLKSMMFNLPAATASHRFPKKDIVSPEGEVSVRDYLFELSGLALNIQSLDEDYILIDSIEENYDTVLSIDRRIRSFKSQTPKIWWVDQPAFFSPELLIQFWHYYLLVRTHLHAAMGPDEHTQHSYSRISCEEACEMMTRIYPTVRRGLPGGFFLCRIVDMQIFTAAAFLLLPGMGKPEATDPRKISMAQSVLETMESVLSTSGPDGSFDFVPGASATIRSLIDLANDGSTSSQNLTLRIPLLGKVRIGRRKTGQLDTAELSQPQEIADGQASQLAEANDQKSTAALQSTCNVAQAPDGNVQQYELPMGNTLPWLMELDMNSSSLEDPFLTENFAHLDQWLGMENMQMGSV